MSWFGRRKAEDYRLLDRQTPHGGVIFWIRNPDNAKNKAFIDRMVKEAMDRFPVGFLAQMAYAQPDGELTTQVVALGDGHCELHMDFKPNTANSGTDQLLKHATDAANAACEIALTLLPVLDDDAIMAEFSPIEKKMNLMIARGPRALMEPLLGRALDATSQIGGGTQWLGFQVWPTDSQKGVFVHTLFAAKDGKKAAIPSVLWRGNNQVLYVGFQDAVADQALKG